MREDTAFPKVRKAGRLIPEAPAALDLEGASDSAEIGRRLPHFRPFGKKVPTHTEQGFRRAAVRQARQSWRAVPGMLEEEAAYGHGFLFVPVMVAAGAVSWFVLPVNPAFWPFFIVFAALVALLAFTRLRSGTTRPGLAALAFFLTGMMLAELETWRRSTILLDSPVTTEVKGVVERREIDADGRWRYIVRVAGTAGPEIRRPPERVSLLARARHTPLETGETVRGRVRISPPSGPALPGLNDFAFSSYFDGIGAVGFFYGVPKKEAVPAAPLSWRAEIERRIFDLRSAIATRIRETVPGDAGAFAAAIVTDERRAISRETTEALRLSGLAHIVAISGLNMALAAGIFFVGVRTALSFFTGFAQAYPVKKIAAVGALGMATAYYLISGFGVSAQRAYIMMAVMLIAVLFDRPAISLRNVALSALIIIAIAPSEILGPSFQMSFAATAALVAGYALWKHRAENRDPEPMPFRHLMVTPVLASWNFTAGIFVTSLIGGISTAIFSVEHFHRIATYGLAANLAAMPIISFVVMPAGLVGMLLMPFGLEGPFLKFMGLGLEAVIAVAEYIAAWGGDVGVGRQHPWFLTIATIGFVLLTLLRTPLRLSGIPLLILALVLSWQERSTRLPDLLVSEDGVMVALIGGEGVATNRTRPTDFVYDQWKRALLISDPIKSQLVSARSSSNSGKLSPARDKPPDRPSSGAPTNLPEAFSPETSGRGLPSGANPEQASGPSPTTDERRDLTKEEVETARAGIRDAPAGHFACVQRAWCASKTRKGVIVAAIEDGRYAGAACDSAHIVVAPRARFNQCRSGALMISGNTLRKTGALEVFLGGATDLRRWRIQAAMAGQNRPWTRHRLYDWRNQDFDSSLPEPLRQMINGSGG